jgi:5-carboxymethyl-2-hydroxymuconate isomerase
LPHGVIENARDVEEQVNRSNLLDVAFDAVLSSGHFDKTSIKARAIALTFVTNAKVPESFNTS